MNPASTTAVTTTPKPSVLDAMATQYKVSRGELFNVLKGTCFKDPKNGPPITNEQMIALCVVAGQYHLNPFLREIYAFPDQRGGIVPVVGVDGWARIMNSRPEFDGIDFEMSGEGDDRACTATIYVKGRSKPVRVTEYHAECFRNTEPWKTMPRRMLRHKALKEAARVAFGFSGIFDEDEAITITSTGDPLAPTPPPARAIEADPDKIPGAESPKAVAPPQPDDGSPQLKLADFVISNGFTFDDFRAWAGSSGTIADADSLASFDDIPEAIARRILRAPNGLKLQLTNARLAKGGAS